MSYPGWRSNRGNGWDPFGELQALRSELGRLMGSALVGLFVDGTPWPMGLVVGLAGLGGLLCARLIKTAPVAQPTVGSNHL